MYGTYHMPRPSRIRDPQYRMHRMSAGGWLLGPIVLIVLIVLAVINWNYQYGTERTVTFTVTRLDDQPTGKSHQYLVFTDGPGGPIVYKDTDSLWHLKFNSSDVFAGLQAGHSYRCSVYGTRLHLISNYPNLLSCSAA